MSKEDRPLISLVNVSGYPYPLPPDIKPRSLRSDANVIRTPRLNVVQWPQLQLDKTTIRIFETVERTSAVLVMPTTSDGQVMFVETEQPGRPKYFGFVAGDLEPHKDPNVFAGAERELLDETGYTAERFHLVYFHVFVPGWDWYAYTVIAENCKQVAKPRPDFGEKCKPFFVNLGELERMARGEDFLYPPVLVNKLLLREEADKLGRLIRNPAAFAIRSYTPGK